MISGLDMVMDSGEDYVIAELDKTKKRLRDITRTLEAQNQFLRLIVQVKVVKIL